MNFDEELRQFRQQEYGTDNLIDQTLRALGVDPVTNERIPSYLDKQLALDQAKKQAGLIQPQAEGESKVSPPPDPPIGTDFSSVMQRLTGAPLTGAAKLAPGIVARVARNVLVRGTAALEDLYDWGLVTARKYIPNPDVQAALGLDLPTTERALSKTIDETVKPYISEAKTGAEQLVTELATIMAPAMAAGKLVGGVTSAVKTAIDIAVSGFFFIDPDQPIFADAVRLLPTVMQDDLQRFMNGKMSEAEYADLVKTRMARRVGSLAENAAFGAIISGLTSFGKALKHGRDVKKVASEIPAMTKADEAIDETLTAAYNQPRTFDDYLKSYFETPTSGKLPPQRPGVIEAGPGTGPTVPNEKALQIVEAHRSALNTEVGTYNLKQGDDALRALGNPAPTRDVLARMDPVKRAAIEQMEAELQPHFGENALTIAIGAVLGIGIFAKDYK